MRWTALSLCLLGGCTGFNPAFDPAETADGSGGGSGRSTGTTPGESSDSFESDGAVGPTSANPTSTTSESTTAIDGATEVGVVTGMEPVCGNGVWEADEECDPLDGKSICDGCELCAGVVEASPACAGFPEEGVNRLVDGSFEGGPIQVTIPDALSGWSGDHSDVVRTVDGLCAPHGEHMVQFLESSGENNDYLASDIVQLIPLEQADAGMVLAASVSCAHVGGQDVANEFFVYLSIYDEDPANYPNVFNEPINRIAYDFEFFEHEPWVWTRHCVEIPIPGDLPKGAFASLHLQFVEAAGVDAQPPNEFAGHVCDDARVYVVGA